MHNIKILYYDRNCAFEGIYIDCTSKWKEYDIFYYWYFLNKGFKFQPYVRNRCHDLLMIPINLSGITIIKIKNTDCLFRGISKSKAIDLLWNTDLTEESWNIKKTQYHEQFLLLQIYSKF